MRFSFLLPLIFLAGCAGQNVQTRIQTIHCVTPAQFAAIVKARPAKVGNTLTGNAQQDFKIVTGKDVLLETYTDGVINVLGGCVGQDK